MVFGGGTPAGDCDRLCDGTKRRARLRTLSHSSAVHRGIATTQIPRHKDPAAPTERGTQHGSGSAAMKRSRKEKKKCHSESQTQTRTLAEPQQHTSLCEGSF